MTDFEISFYFNLAVAFLFWGFLSKTPYIKWSAFAGCIMGALFGAWVAQFLP